MIASASWSVSFILKGEVEKKCKHGVDRWIEEHVSHSHTAASNIKLKLKHHSIYLTHVYTYIYFYIYQSIPKFMTCYAATSPLLSFSPRSTQTLPTLYEQL